jgi:hypothetical protein
MTGQASAAGHDPSNAAQAVRAALGVVLILSATRYLIARAAGEPRLDIQTTA